MNIKNITLILLLFSLLNVSLHSLTLDQKISAMQKASPERRVKMMNAIKHSLMSMNTQDRQKAISKLRNRVRGSSKSSRSSTTTMLAKRASVDQMNQSVSFQHSSVLNSSTVIESVMPNNPKVDVPSNIPNDNLNNIDIDSIQR